MRICKSPASKRSRCRARPAGSSRCRARGAPARASSLGTSIKSCIAAPAPRWRRLLSKRWSMDDVCGHQQERYSRRRRARQGHDCEGLRALGAGLRSGVWSGVRSGPARRDRGGRAHRRSHPRGRRRHGHLAARLRSQVPDLRHRHLRGDAEQGRGAGERAWPEPRRRARGHGCREPVVSGCVLRCDCCPVCDHDRPQSGSRAQRVRSRAQAGWRDHSGEPHRGGNGLAPHARALVRARRPTAWLAHRVRLGALSDLGAGDAAHPPDRAARDAATRAFLAHSLRQGLHRQLKERPKGRTMSTFLQALETQRWDDHRYYHHSRINQALHLLSAISFVCAYVLVFFNPMAAILVAWLIGMTSRQIGHFFFEPKTYDEVNQATHEHKEDIKVGYNLQRKVVLMSIWAASPLVLFVDPSVFGVFEPYHDLATFTHHTALIWLTVGLGGLVFRTVQLFFIKDVQTGLVWFTKIITDPFHDIKLYHKSPMYLMRGELFDVPQKQHG